MRTVAILFLVTLVLPAGCKSPKRAAASDAQRIASQAFIYAYPMLENYKSMYAMTIDEKSPAYLGRMNVVHNKTQLLGPEFKEIVRPNNDTLYSMAYLDLRSEPMVLTVPAIDPARYYSWQLVDMYTQNFAYVGSRATGSDAGSYMIAGPEWNGATPVGVEAVFRSETQLVFALARVAVDGEADVQNVIEIQEQFILQPLSAFLAQDPPVAPAPLWYPAYDPELASSAGFVGYFNFLLDLCPPRRSEAALFDRFTRVGIGPGRPLTIDAMAPGLRRTLDAGATMGRSEIEAERTKLGRGKNGWSMVLDAFGDPQKMAGRFLVRAAAARMGLYGNDEEEAYYPALLTDSDGNAVDAANHDYVLTFTKNELPPVNAFWSITMYDLPAQLMVANPIQRYSIGDRTAGLVYAEDGSLTIYMQAESPGADKQSNWLPAPKGPFTLQARLYWPRPVAFTEDYAPPPLRKAK